MLDQFAPFDHLVGHGGVGLFQVQYPLFQSPLLLLHGGQSVDQTSVLVGQVGRLFHFRADAILLRSATRWILNEKWKKELNYFLDSLRLSILLRTVGGKGEEGVADALPSFCPLIRLQDETEQLSWSIELSALANELDESLTTSRNRSCSLSALRRSPRSCRLKSAVIDRIRLSAIRTSSWASWASWRALAASSSNSARWAAASSTWISYWRISSPWDVSVRSKFGHFEENFVV